MSNDASPDDQRAQSTHALEMKVERKLQKDTGFNRHQIRRALHGSVTDFVNQVNRANVGHPEKQIDLPEVKHSQPQILPPLPFSVTNKEPATDKTVNEDLGSASNPYVMGTNKTTPDASAADDSWTPSGPSPSGGGPYDGVVIPSLTRIYELGTGSGFILYTRALHADSRGKVILVDIESGQHITSF